MPTCSRDNACFNHPKIYQSTMPQIRCGVKVYEKGVALRLGEKRASHITPSARASEIMN